MSGQPRVLTAGVMGKTMTTHVANTTQTEPLVAHGTVATANLENVGQPHFYCDVFHCPYCRNIGRQILSRDVLRVWAIHRYQAPDWRIRLASGAQSIEAAISGRSCRILLSYPHVCGWGEVNAIISAEYATGLRQHYLAIIRQPTTYPDRIVH